MRCTIMIWLQGIFYKYVQRESKETTSLDFIFLHFLVYFINSQQVAQCIHFTCLLKEDENFVVMLQGWLNSPCPHPQSYVVYLLRIRC